MKGFLSSSIFGAYGNNCYELMQYKGLWNTTLEKFKEITFLI